MAMPVFFVQPRPNFHIATYLWAEPDGEAKRSVQLATVYSENQWLLDHWIPIIPTVPEEPYQPLKFTASQGMNPVRTPLH